MSRFEPFTWIQGAAWLLPDGEPVVVPGFHDEWIRAHQDVAPGCANVCDVVMKLRWLSVVSYSQGYVEIMLSSRRDSASVELCVEHLGRNLARWETALVMTMDEEGYIRLSRADFAATADGSSPAGKIRGAFATDAQGR